MRRHDAFPTARDWAAWIDRVPGPDNDNPTLHVTGACSFPTEGWPARSCRSTARTPTPSDFHLRLVTWPPAEGVGRGPHRRRGRLRRTGGTAATSISIEMVAETLPVGDVF